MEYKNQKEKLVNYFENGETQNELIGMEIEHFVVDQNTLKAVTYQEEDGIESILHQLTNKDWKGKKEKGYLVGLNSSQAAITLEPGGQLEIAINPQKDINKLREIYFEFLQDVIPILEEKGYYLITLGYQPESKIKEIDWNPKKRYKIMSNYLGAQGKYAHNMMKGTAALQVALDYQDEKDFICKFRIANFLSPVMAILLDNAPIFEGKIYTEKALRTKIWSNTDDKRTGIVTEAFTNDFGYEKYSEYILDQEPILIKSNGEYISTDNKTCKEIFKNQQFGIEELEHILTMVFPDVRAKNFIEIRMTDSLPPQFSFAIAAFWKGLLYDRNNLNNIYQFMQQFNVDEILQARKEITSNGLETALGNYTVLEIAQKVIKWAEDGLKKDDKYYLTPLKKLVDQKETLASKIKNNYKKNKKEVIENAILNSLVREENKE